MTNQKKISKKVNRFVEEYIIDLNATQAAIRAGYSKKTAGAIGYENLKKPEIWKLIQDEMEKRSKRTEVTADKVINELVKIGFSNMLDYVRVNEHGDLNFNLSNLNRDNASAISEITIDEYKEGTAEDVKDVKKIKFKLYDKRAALIELGKHTGLFTNKHEITGANGGAILTQTIDTSKLSDEVLKELIVARFNNEANK